MTRQQTGKKGEDEACTHLIGLGHTILERNWRGGHTELDIISLAPDGVHFVEVKSRTEPCQAEPEANVTRAKIRHLTEAAGRYLRSADRRNLSDCEIFFDVVTVIFSNSGTKIEYYPQAFIPTYA